MSIDVKLSLQAAQALTKKYLDMVGVREIGNLEITELREVHYLIRDSLDQMAKTDWDVIVTKADQKNPRTGESFIQKETVDTFPTKESAEAAADELRRRYQTVYLKPTGSKGEVSK